MTAGADQDRTAPGFAWPAGFRAAASFTFDVDAESAILFADPASAGRRSVMSHQAYGPRTGVPRLLSLLDRTAIKATFFVPGYTAERWPDTIRSIRDAGHEIAHHGFMHESVAAVTPDEEERLLLRGLAALDSVAGVRPSGWRAPMWEASWASAEILARNGFRYDSSLMDADQPYLLAVGDSGGLVELPIHWSLDDWEPYVFLPDLSGSGTIASPAEVGARWALELDAMAADGGLFLLTNHPFVSGRASRAAALATLIERAKATDGLWIATCDEIARWVETLALEPVDDRRPRLPAD
ncbi:MAG TPA: polysaccharide deacetylase [Candidatus Limnocylindrales bacterium]|jgi:peptidoglycan/xylan/chitin deacetylase (PgdA/CDA1 family)